MNPPLEGIFILGYSLIYRENAFTPLEVGLPQFIT